MAKNKERKTKKLSMGKSCLIGTVLTVLVGMGIMAIGTSMVSSGKIGEGEIESIATASVFIGTLIGSAFCSKIGGGAKGGLTIAAVMIIVRIIFGAFSEFELICACTLSGCLSAALGGFGGVLLSKSRKKRRHP